LIPSPTFYIPILALFQAKDLDTIWRDPVASYRLVQGNPIFKALPGVAALAEKQAEEWTKEDVGNYFLANLV